MNDRVVTILIYLTLFSSSLTLWSRPFEMYPGYIIMIGLFPFFLLRHGFPIRLLGVFVPLVVIGLFNIYLGTNTFGLFVKIFLGLFMSTLFYYYVCRAYNLDVPKLFGYYMKASVIISYLALFQLASFLVGFEYGYDYNWIFNKWAYNDEGLFGIRINSIFAEPSQYAMVLAPAVFFAIYNIVKKENIYLSRLNSWLMVTMFLLTFSTVAYTGLMITIVLLLLNYGLFRYSMFLLPVGAVVFYLMYTNIPDFHERVEDTYTLYSTGEMKSVFDYNSSVVVSYNNFHVALENFKENPLFGTGLGSHDVAFDKYSLTKNVAQFGFANNAADANSLFYRLMSETGLLGLGFMGFFIWKFFVRRKEGDPDDIRWLISAALLLMILLYLIRQGHYFLNGFPFFMWLYYYNSILPFGLRRNAEE